MNIFFKYFSLILLAIFITACGGGDEQGTGNNSNIQLPSTLVGQTITFTVTDSGSSGIPVGYKIKWTFSSGGVIRGVNPVSGQVVTPNSYTYSVSGGKGYVDVRYVQGTQTAYEIYTMIDATRYTYEGNTGSGVKTASGTYVIQ